MIAAVASALAILVEVSLPLVVRQGELNVVNILVFNGLWWGWSAVTV